jgi:8-oxo-dGTP pyrophosphatase MutT (NUDIX family)
MEIPAGMLDASRTFAGVAAKEIKEETGLVIHEDELKNLTELALGGVGGKESKESLQDAMYPSPGGSDEFIHIFLWEKVLDRQEIEDLRGKLTGLRTQGERSRLEYWIMNSCGESEQGMRRHWPRGLFMRR